MRELKSLSHLPRMAGCRGLSFMNTNLTSENIFAKINIDKNKGGAYEWRN